MIEGRFPRTRSEVPELVYLASTGSTNADLLQLADELPAWTVLLSLDQTSGRGRLGRRWVAPPGQTLAASVLVRPGARLPDDEWGWFPMLMGLAVKEAVGAVLPDRSVALKWPNDLLVGERKICGILGEVKSVRGRPEALVMGLGINLTIGSADLPTPTSTSLRVEGRTEPATDLADEVLSLVIARFRILVEAVIRQRGVRFVPDLADDVAEACDSLGRRVRVELPTGEVVIGTATALDPFGRLVVLPDGTDDSLTVGAGDVTHLRYE